jgi:hypothetical protein
MSYPIRFLVIVLVGVALSGRATPPGEADHHNIQQTEPSMGRHLPNKDIREFGEVTLTLCRGGQPTRTGLQTLADMGIDIVVNTWRKRERRRR